MGSVLVGEDSTCLRATKPMCCAQSLSRVWLFATQWTVVCQAPLSMGILQARILEWVAMPSSRGSSQLRDWTQVSCIAGKFFTIWATREAQLSPCTPTIEPLALEPRSHGCWSLWTYSLGSTIREVTTMRSRTPQLEKSPCSNEDPAQPEINIIFKKEKRIPGTF